jgi:hypothetical protein
VNAGDIKISIIIVTYNSLGSLPSCLAQLREASRRINCELVAVDNNSTDNSPSAIRNFWPQANVIVNRKNKGFAFAANQGAKASAGEFLLFVNPDLFVDNNCLEEFLFFIRGKERIGAVGGRMRFPDGTFQPTCRKLPTLSNLVFSRGSFLGRIIRSTHKYTLPDSAVPTEVPAVAGTLLFIRKEVFESVGRFDANYFMYMEDTDLCKRLIMLGFSNFFLPQAGAVHEWGTGSPTGVFKRNWYHHASVFRYFRKYRRGSETYILLPVLLLLNFLLSSLVNAIKPSKK